MKIAIFHELPFGGAKRVAEAFGKSLSASHEVVFFTVGADQFHPTLGRGLSRIKHDTWDLIHLMFIHRRLAKEIDDQKFDLVIVHPSQWTQAPWILSFLHTPSAYYCQEPLRIVYDPLLSDL